MSQKQARAIRKTIEAKKPTAAQPVQLGATGASILALVKRDIELRLSSPEVQLLVAGFLDGRGLSGKWGVNLPRVQLGDVWLMPEQPSPGGDRSGSQAQVDNPSPNGDST